MPYEIQILYLGLGAFALCILLKLNSNFFFSASVSFCGLFKDTIDAIFTHFFIHILPHKTIVMKTVLIVQRFA